MADGWIDGLTLPTPTLLAGDAGVIVSAPALTSWTLAAGSADAALTVVALTSWTLGATGGPPQGSEISLPALSTWTLAATGSGPNASSPSLPALSTWPLTFGDAGAPSLSLPALSTWTAASTFIHAADGIGSMPMPTLDASGTCGELASAILVAPMPTIIVSGDTRFTETMASITISATGVVGQIGSAQLVAPVATVSGILLAGRDGTFDAIAPMFTLAATGRAAQLGTAALTLPTPFLVATGLTGNVGSIIATAPSFSILAAGYGKYDLSAALTMSMFTLDASGQVGVAESYRTWVLNLRKKGLTEYDSTYAFNSYANFRGTILCASPAGLFKQTGQNDDNGAAILSTVRTGKDDFGTSFNKRVPRAYVGVNCADNLYVSTITTEGSKRTYVLAGNDVTGVQQRRVPIGRGPKSPWWQFEITNPTGADFLLTHLVVRPEKSYRRVV